MNYTYHTQINRYMYMCKHIYMYIISYRYMSIIYSICVYHLNVVYLYNMQNCVYRCIEDMCSTLDILYIRLIIDQTKEHLSRSEGPRRPGHPIIHHQLQYSSGNLLQFAMEHHWMNSIEQLDYIYICIYGTPSNGLSELRKPKSLGLA